MFGLLRNYRRRNSNGNVFYKGLYAYTKGEPVLVRTIYVAYLPEGVDETKIKEYFSQYGEILGLKIHEKIYGRGKSIFRYGFVTFKDAYSASMALRCKTNMLGTKRIMVKAADSWNQPTAENDSKEMSLTKEIEDDQKNEENEEKKKTILELDDDCLIHIFSFLSLREQLKLSTVCERFQQVFGLKFKIKKLLNISKGEEWTLSEMRQITTKVGIYIQKVHITLNDSITPKITPRIYYRCLHFISSSCPNLRRIELTNIEGVPPAIYKTITYNLRNLTRVELRKCSLTDQVCNYLSHLKYLEYLDIRENIHLTGEFLSKFPKLTQLNMEYCRNIQLDHFSELCRKRRLKSLNIIGCEKLSISALSEMVSCLDILEKLEISSSCFTIGCLQIDGLKTLKELTISCENGCPNNLFRNLAKMETKNLESLILINGVPDVQDEEFIFFVESLKKVAIRMKRGYFPIYCSYSNAIKTPQDVNLENYSLIAKKHAVKVFFANLRKIRLEQLVLGLDEIDNVLKLK